MKQNDIVRLVRVAGFGTGDKKDKLLEVETIAKNLEDRLANSKEMRAKMLRDVSAKMKKQGINMENAFKYFDDDGSGVINREELVEGFNRMEVTLNQGLINNLFVILDRNVDNKITFEEFEAVFEKYLGTGGAVQDLEDGHLVDFKVMSAADKAKLKKEMNAEQKKTQVYEDRELEAIPIDEIEKLNEARVDKIKAGTVG